MCMCVHVQMHGLMHHRLQSLNNLMKVLIAVLLVRERVTERGPRAVSCCSCCAEAQDEQQKQRMETELAAKRVAVDSKWAEFYTVPNGPSAPDKRAELKAAAVELERAALAIAEAALNELAVKTTSRQEVALMAELLIPILRLLVYHLLTHSHLTPQP